MAAKSKQYKELYAQFEKEYDLSMINNANDATSLDVFINNTILIQQWQTDIMNLSQENSAEHITTISKLSDRINNTLEANQKIERQLGIDRKSRKKDASVSTADYIMHLQVAAQEFMQQRLQRVYCPNCNVMVFRFSPVHDHTAFMLGVQCSQCGKIVTAERKERDIFFDLKPNDIKWRKLFPVEIKHPKANKAALDDTVEPDMIIDDDMDTE